MVRAHFSDQSLELNKLFEHIAPHLQSPCVAMRQFSLCTFVSFQKLRPRQAVRQVGSAMPFALGVALLLVGCATTEGLPVEDRRRLFDAERDSVISAVVTTLTEEGYQVSELDRQTGLIITDTRKTFGYLSGLDRTSVTGRVQSVGDQPGGLRSRLTLTISTEQEGGIMPGSRMRGSKAREIYDELFRSIEANLN